MQYFFSYFFGLVRFNLIQRSASFHRFCITTNFIIYFFFLFIRKLEHPHIVKFYGTSLIKEEITTRVILVVEKCKGNLKSQIFDHPEVVPANSSNSAVYGDVCRWAKEITDALEFIHKQGIIHRNLTMETIVV